MKPKNFFLLAFIIVSLACSCYKNQHQIVVEADVGETNMDSLFLEQSGKYHPVLNFEKCVEIFTSAKKKPDGEIVWMDECYTQAG